MIYTIGGFRNDPATGETLEWIHPYAIFGTTETALTEAVRILAEKRALPGRTRMYLFTAGEGDEINPDGNSR